MAFNVLTDCWIPLDDDKGLASYVDLLTGVRDAPDLVHPRDDCRFFARMLLSALTQALFPAANARELRARIDTPLPTDVVLRQVEAVREDFDLLAASDPWMQSPVASNAAENETSQVLLDVAKHLLFRPAVRPDALCAPCAVVIIYGLQAFVPKGGRGYSPNIRGAPPTTTLVISPTSVRKSAWASTLHTQRASGDVIYGQDPDRPWRCHVAERDGAMIGLVEGLFWKPRALRLVETSARACTTCGRDDMTLLSVAGFGSRQRRTGGKYRHPMTPCVRVPLTKSTTELRFAKLHSDRPAWTALADWISAVAGDAEGSVPAPVVAQWAQELARPGEPSSLMVLDYGTRDASVLHRFVESFPLSLRLTAPDVIASVRSRVDEAEAALDALKTACVRLHMKTRPNVRLGKNQSARARKERQLVHDATAAFWQRTEPAFWCAYEAAVGEDIGAQVEAEAEFLRIIHRAARDLFDAHAEPSITDPSRVAVLAEVRGALVADLASQARRA